MTTQFDATITLYHRINDSWVKKVVGGVYYSEKYKLDVKGEERTSYKVRQVIIPTKTLEMSVGDIVIKGTCELSIDEYGSGNNIINAGGWVVSSVADNRHTRCSVSHIEGSDE